MSIIATVYAQTPSNVTSNITSYTIPSTEYPGNPIPKLNKAWDTTGPVLNKDLAIMVQTQASIWIPIILFIITLAATCALCTTNQGKDRDSLLYAKFLSNVSNK